MWRCNQTGKNQRRGYQAVALEAWAAEEKSNTSSKARTSRATRGMAQG